MEQQHRVAIVGIGEMKCAYTCANVCTCGILCDTITHIQQAKKEKRKKKKISKNMFE